jgi:hypothetical protein
MFNESMLASFMGQMSGPGPGTATSLAPWTAGKSLVTNVNQAKLALKYEINNLSSGCQSALSKAGDTTAVLLATANNMQFYNGSAQGSTLLSTIPNVAPVQPNGGGTTLGSVLSNPAYAATGGPPHAATLYAKAGTGEIISNVVDLAASFFSGSYYNVTAPAGSALALSQQVADQLATLLHEELHFLTQTASDSALEDALRIGPRGDTNQDPINYWLSNGCKQQ